MTVDNAFDRIRQIGFDTETIYACYVTDRSRHLLGIVSVKDLLLSDDDTVIEDLMDTNNNNGNNFTCYSCLTLFGFFIKSIIVIIIRLFFKGIMCTFVLPFGVRLPLS
mgnify:CR=1 FL=1